MLSLNPPAIALTVWARITTSGVVINSSPDWVSLPGVPSQVEDERQQGVFLLSVCGDTRNLLTRAEVYSLFGKQGEKNINLQTDLTTHRMKPNQIKLNQETSENELHYITRLVRESMFTYFVLLQL